MGLGFDFTVAGFPEGMAVFGAVGCGAPLPVGWFALSFDLNGLLGGNVFVGFEGEAGAMGCFSFSWVTAACGMRRPGEGDEQVYKMNAPASGLSTETRLAGTSHTLTFAVGALPPMANLAR